MARTARTLTRTEIQPSIAEPVYRTGIYARLSREDNLSGSMSIEHQIAICKDYLSGKAAFRLTDVFSDNGFTGTDFDRPQWQRLMGAIRSGEINCVLVKDLSRLGRNYIETGEFLEKLCPFFGVRFISINDGFDTNTADSSRILSASLSNIVNDFYAKDISRKVCTAIRGKVEKGEYIGDWAKYGYEKSPANKNQLVVDPETAPVIQMIYELRAQGMSCLGINKKLNDMGIPSPSQRKADMGIVTNNNQKDRVILWNRHMVTEILNDITYLGHLAQRKIASSLYAGLRPTRLAPEDWIVVENTHEAIISQELFDAVQAINREAARKQKQNHDKYPHLPKAVNIYGGKFTCADCGATMKLVRTISRKKDKAYFTFKCPVHEEHGARGCLPKRIRKADLDQAVLTALRSQFKLFLRKKGMLEKLQKRTADQKQKPQKLLEAQDIQKKIRQKRSLFSGLYQDLRDGLLSDEDYDQTREVLLADIAQLEEQLRQADDADQMPPEVENELNRWSGLVEQYYHAAEVTAPLVEAMIESMELHQDNSLTIHFNYMDSFRLFKNQIKQFRKESA